MNYRAILDDVGNYYGEKLKAHGATPQGVDWNSRESQELRFAQLLKIRDGADSFSVNDYGCGYAALVEYLIRQGFTFEYTGFDISVLMIEKAKELHAKSNFCRFVSDESLLTVADYTVASGIFNVKLSSPDEEWQPYVLNTIKKIDALSKRGFAFNMLTEYSDPEYMRPDLYYPAPSFFFDYCKRNVSKHVSLLHDYPLYEFTILVRK
ncbi:MAG: class I SAM-dependent methyltransferase [Candidatus Omnitrophota bacterium]|nr:class I SAM-dependent methyltransferase [Candidatus Omnitrophota bacterium]